MSAETVQEGAQHAALWGASAQCLWGGEVGVGSRSLGLVGGKVFYPGACERVETEGVDLACNYKSIQSCNCIPFPEF